MKNHIPDVDDQLAFKNDYPLLVANSIKVSHLTSNGLEKPFARKYNKDLNNHGRPIQPNPLSEDNVATQDKQEATSN